MLVAMTLVADADWGAAADALDVALEIGAAVDDRDVLWNLGNAALQLGDDGRSSSSTPSRSRARARRAPPRR